MGDALLSTDLPGAISRRQGKVRDIYDYGDGMLIIASDRISCFDVVLPNGITDKGKILTDISLRWFDLTGGIQPNHLISADVADFPEPTRAFADQLAGRSMWVKKADVVQVECVVRGYLAGSGWKEYSQSGTINGEAMPDGLVESARLPEPIFTPSTKEESGHDIPINFEQTIGIVGEAVATEIRDKSLQLYKFGADYADSRGFILCDTKFEFGVVDGELILVDEVLTPDSSRYWDKAKYEPGGPQEAFDKQYVRDYLLTLDWDQTYPGPVLPDEVVAEARRIYDEARTRLFA
ncbi:MAG TPA: phosphoribosylaminoimidazolesuccinocarboxamide synthase [Armatimonadota bacterium]|nr:phosphoribosylaminoimidazolesuccinocarboxamide synthase [Armatimonadota bacterium]